MWYGCWMNASFSVLFGTSFGGCCLFIYSGCWVLHVLLFEVYTKISKKTLNNFPVYRSFFYGIAFYFFPRHRKGALVFLRVFLRFPVFYRFCFVFFWPYIVAIILRVLLACCALWMWCSTCRRVLTKLLRCISPGHFEEQLCRTPYQTNHLIKKTGKQFSADAVCLYSAFGFQQPFEVIWFLPEEFRRET